MAGLSRSMFACFHTGQLALLAILVSGGIVLQILACALYNNWWPMLTVIMYVILPMPLLFFAGSNGTSLMSSDGDGLVILELNQTKLTNASVSFILTIVVLSLYADYRWAKFTKFLTGASVIGSIAIPSILKHADIICWEALVMELSSFLIFAIVIVWFLQMNNEDGYSMF